MRAEKQYLTNEYLARLNASPFFIVVDYKGLKVAPMTELRKRLQKAGSEVHIVKNSIFRLAAKEAGVADLNGSLTGQVAVVTGQKDISAAAKVVKTFNAEFDKLKIHLTDWRRLIYSRLRIFRPSRCCAANCWESCRRRRRNWWCC